MGATLLRNCKALHVDGIPSGSSIDVGIGPDGAVVPAGTKDSPRFERVIDCQGAWLSPAWIDPHVHCYHGGTWLSVRPEHVGPATGVGLAVDCGSAGEANFAGLREFIIDPAPFPILAYLNVSSIGLVAVNRLSELISDAVLNPARAEECVETHRDVIRGIKVRASDQVVKQWGVAPVRAAKHLARAVGLPLVVHIGEAPPTLDEILDLVEPGDMITHCFTGRITTSIARHEPYFRRIQALAAEGLVLDIGHGQGSFNYGTARYSVERGLLPTTISTDLHIGSIWGPAWDLATVMSKMLTVGMSVDDVVAGVTVNPAKFLRLTRWGWLAPGTQARFTVFDVSDAEERLPDSDGNVEIIRRFFEPRYTVIGPAVTPAGRNITRDRQSTPI
ncbi:MAG TPA: amidohydrolase/deacetylase family metallohydrolase [bacterium]|jgi:dihydroorotase|nr:amidohydrolase/deacetylase family metallohydrolase [bacterium]